MRAVLMNNNKMDDLYIIMYCLWVASVCPYKITHKLSVSQLSVFYRILKVVERTAGSRTRTINFVQTKQNQGSRNSQN